MTAPQSPQQAGPVLGQQIRESGQAGPLPPVPESAYPPDATLLEPPEVWQWRAEARRALVEAELAHRHFIDVDGASSYAVRMNEEAADVALAVLEPLVADLLAQARADGVEEGRGDMEALEREWRADERERIHDEIADRQHAELVGNIPPAGSPTQAYDYARRIVRRSS